MQHFPRGTDVSTHCPTDLQAAAAALSTQFHDTMTDEHSLSRSTSSFARPPMMLLWRVRGWRPAAWISRTAMNRKRVPYKPSFKTRQVRSRPASWRWSEALTLDQSRFRITPLAVPGMPRTLLEA